MILLVLLNMMEKGSLLVWLLRFCISLRFLGFVSVMVKFSGVFCRKVLIGLVWFIVRFSIC